MKILCIDFSSIFEENLYAKSEKRQAEEDDLSYFGVEGFDDRGIKQEKKDEAICCKKSQTYGRQKRSCCKIISKRMESTPGILISIIISDTN